MSERSVEKISVCGVFRDATGKPYNLDRSATRILRLMIEEGEGIEVELPIHRLNATQETVNADFLEAAAKLRADGYDLPAVVKFQGGYYVSDGHHRIMAAAAAGRKVVDVRLFDIDGDTQLEFPLLDLIEKEPERDSRCAIEP